jgi:hypothetical protein
LSAHASAGARSEAPRLERALARRAQALGDRRVDVSRPVEDLADFAGEELLVHRFRV